MENSASKPIVTWTHDIAHLFTALDKSCMYGVSAGVIELDNYESVKRSAKVILGCVQNGTMPPGHSGEPQWPPERVKLFEEWIATGLHQ